MNEDMYGLPDKLLPIWRDREGRIYVELRGQWIWLREVLAKPLSQPQVC